MPNDVSVSTSGAPGGSSDLVVESGETVLLSPDSQRFGGLYKQVNIRTIDEVRSLLGPSQAAAKALKTFQCCESSSVLAAPEDLTSKDSAVRTRAKNVALQAASQYVRSADPGRFEQWKALIDRYIAIGNPSIWHISLGDIEIFDGGTLVVSASTSLLFANNIKIHDSGRIKCEGDLTVKCQTLQGIRRIVTRPVKPARYEVRA